MRSLMKLWTDHFRMRQYCLQACMLVLHSFQNAVDTTRFTSGISSVGIPRQPITLVMGSGVRFAEMNPYISLDSPRKILWQQNQENSIIYWTRNFFCSTMTMDLLCPFNDFLLKVLPCTRHYKRTKFWENLYRRKLQSAWVMMGKGKLWDESDNITGQTITISVMYITYGSLADMEWKQRAGKTLYHPSYTLNYW